MIAEAWIEEARGFATGLAADLPADLAEEQLTPKIVRFVFSSHRPNTATVNVVISAFEVIIGAGAGTWIELGPLSTDGPRATELIRSVAAGRLTEVVSRGRVRFELTLSDGEVVRGGTSSLLATSRPRKRVTYATYASAV